MSTRPPTINRWVNSGLSNDSIGRFDTSEGPSGYWSGSSVGGAWLSIVHSDSRPLQIMQHATNVRSPEWDKVDLINLKYHDTIWFNAIREYVKLQRRKGTEESDEVLDNLIRQGLIDQEEGDVSKNFQQLLRYSASMAGRLTDHQFKLEKKVRSPPGLTNLWVDRSLRSLSLLNGLPTRCRRAWGSLRNLRMPSKARMP